MKKITAYLVMAICAFASALNYKVFVFPNSFAPSGLDGICTMVQYLTNTSMGYLSLIVNIPLLIVSWRMLSKDFVIKSSMYIVCFSSAILFFNYVETGIPVYHTETGTSIVLAPIAAGVIRGLLYVVTLKFGGTSGGVDIVASIVKKKKPQYNLMSIIFALNVLVAVSAFFVYGYKFEPVICSIVYSFITSLVSKSISSSESESVRIEVITAESEKLCQEITQELGVTATVLEAQGAYSGSDKKLVLCVLSKDKAPKMEELLKKHTGLVVFESVVNNSLYIEKADGNL